MSSSTDRPGFSIYNPAILHADDLAKQFVVRTELLEHLLEELRHVDGRRPPQHQLITGPRGMGKTTLLLRLRGAIQEDTRLAKRLLPLTFPEEQYDVTDLGSLWMNALDALADNLERAGRADAVRALEAEVAALDEMPSDRRATAALERLLGWAAAHKKCLVLLLDNFDLILDRLSSGDHHWELRKILQSHPRLVIVAASTVPPGATYEYSKAFYDFFRVHVLESLDLAECRRLLLRLAEVRDAPRVARAVEEHPERICALHELTGGSPRALSLLFFVLSESDELRTVAALERTLDLATPYYKHVIEALAPAQRTVFDAVARNWHSLEAREVATRTGMAVTEASSHLSRLERAGIVEKHDAPDSAKFLFRVSERLMNVWYLMRSSRRSRERLRWLGAYIEASYRADEVLSRAKGLLAKVAQPYRPDAAGTLDLALAYADCVSATHPGLSSLLDLHATRHVAENVGDSLTEEWGSRPKKRMHTSRADVAESLNRAMSDPDWPRLLTAWGELVLRTRLSQQDVREIVRKARPQRPEQWRELAALWFLMATPRAAAASFEATSKAIEAGVADGSTYFMRMSAARQTDGEVPEMIRRAGTPRDRWGLTLEKPSEAEFLAHFRSSIFGARAIVRSATADRGADTEAVIRFALFVVAVAKPHEVVADLRAELGPLSPLPDESLPRFESFCEWFLCFAGWVHDSGGPLESETVAVRSNALQLVSLMESLGIAERWRPLREAIRCVELGSDAHLARLAPEIRRPAKRVLDAWPDRLRRGGLRTS